MVRWQQKQMDEALSLLQRAVQSSPQNAQAHFYLGRILEETGQPAKAIEEVQAAVKLQPGFVEAQTQLGKMLQRSGDAPGCGRGLPAACPTASQ